MTVWPRRAIAITLGMWVGLGVVGASFATLVFELPWPWAAGSLAAGLLGAARGLRRYWRRRRLVREPFPADWRAQLERCVPFYRGLDAAGRKRFEDDVRIFLAEQRISGPRGEPAPDDARLLVGASAAMLGHGRPEWEWPTMRDIVIYPTAFNEDYDVGEHEHVLGMVHAQGPILFSARDLRHGFRISEDGQNVGLHELAHVMDFADGAADGVPSGVEWIGSAPWVEVVADRLKRLRHDRRRQVLRRYGATNEAELFAVAVEAFFEKAEQLHEHDPELYEMLADYFQLDPAGVRE